MCFGTEKETGETHLCAVLKIFLILLLRGFISHFHGQNKCKIRTFVYFRLGSKKLINWKGKKNVNFGFKCTFSINS